MIKFNDTFLRQTATDYDMELHEVKRISILFPDEFYDKLEEFIGGLDESL